MTKSETSEEIGLLEHVGDLVLHGLLNIGLCVSTLKHIFDIYLYWWVWRFVY